MFIVIVVAVLILLLVVLMMALFVRVMRRGVGGSAGGGKNSKNVTIIEKGPSGTIRYTEKGQTCEFYWEYSGGDSVACIWFPADDANWDEKYPWAAGRRMQIVKDVAEQVRRQKSPTSKIKWESDRFHLLKK